MWEKLLRSWRSISLECRRRIRLKTPTHSISPVENAIHRGDSRFFGRLFVHRSCLIVVQGIGKAVRDFDMLTFANTKAVIQAAFSPETHRSRDIRNHSVGNFKTGGESRSEPCTRWLHGVGRFDLPDYLDISSLWLWTLHFSSLMFVRSPARCPSVLARDKFCIPTPFALIGLRR